jgi:hypothetical protein
MGFRLKRTPVTGVLCALLVVFGALAVFGLSAWADRGRQDDRALAFNAIDIEFAKRQQYPAAYAPTRNRSPLGDVRPDWTTPLADPGASIETPLGFVNPRDLGDLRRRVPGLAGNAGRRLTRPGQQGELAPGYNAIQIGDDALAARTMDAIAAELQTLGVRVHQYLAHQALLVHVPKDRVDAVAAHPAVRGAMPWDAMFRVEAEMGRRAYLERARSESDRLELVVEFFRGADRDRAHQDLKALSDGEVVDWGIDGLSFQTRAHYTRVPQIARLEHVAMVREVPEFQLLNTEIPTIAMVGNLKENLPFQKPYHDVGVDGGGIDTSGDGQRINNGTDTVPPQIVAVTDNGLSVDSIQFSQTATQPTSIIAPVGPGHRKVHALQNVADAGTNSCDGTLSGAGTHGNVVAGVIAGDGSALGARVSKHIYNSRPRVDNLQMDGLARGARILMQDAADVSRCTINDFVERGGNVLPGSLAARLQAAICPKSGGTGACSGLIGGAEEVHLHVMPFGTPNFDLLLANPTDGTYTSEAREIDTFLVNNRDYMVFAPVGNQGTERGQRFFSSFIGESKNNYPDLFNGTVNDDDPNFPRPIQIAAPATAKNLVSVGAHFQDVQTAFGINEEENLANFSSKGPATAGSLRMAPMITGVGADATGFFFAPNTTSIAVWKSTDNDNLAPVDAVLDDINFGTSYAAAEIAGVGALVRDYFAQGFYPTGTRQTDDRIPNVSGPLVKAAIAASANFLEQHIVGEYRTANDQRIARSRATDMGSVGGQTIGILGNSEQGYGRPVVTSVLPLANWPTAKGVGAPDTLEYAAAGLVAYDEIATGELAINNTRVQNEHQFLVTGDATMLVGTTRVISRGQMRVAVAWADPPNTTGASGTLINDLDLEVESPGPDNNIATTADNVVYDGNNYFNETLTLGQWSRPRPFGSADIGDRRNPVEAIHLSADPNGDRNAADSQIPTGTWKVRVKRGAGGATAGQITILTGAVEDANRNGRLDAGEDTDGDGFLDADGQPYGLVIAGPVLGTENQTLSGGRTLVHPGSVARLDKSLYSCADQATATVVDPGATAASVAAATTLQVVTRTGTVIDSERSFAFTSPGGSVFVSPSIAVREGKPAVANNGVLETNGVAAEEPYAIRVQYADTPRSAAAQAPIHCAPSLLAWHYMLEDHNATQQVAIGGGCDRDQFMDAGETVTYSVTFVNSNRDQDLLDVQASLSVAGAGANAVRVLNTPQNLGRIPGGQISSATFAVRIDAAALAPIAVNNRLVDMTLTLSSSNQATQLARQTFTFRHALNSDYETFHYSTDYPLGGREIRDFNRNLQIDRADVTDPFIGIVLPDEDLTFASMNIVGTTTGLVTNMLGEDLNNNGARDGGEPDVIPDGVLNRGILTNAVGTTTPMAPFNFDLHNGGWTSFRSPFSRPGGSTSPVWEHVRNGQCGFQTAIPDGNPSSGFQNLGAGVWHTGDGNLGTPTATGACDSHQVPTDGATPQQNEFIQDFLVSPIIAKVHQTLDARGLPYTAEFQRLGFNMNAQIEDDLSGLNWNVDNNAEDDSGNCILCQDFDFNYGGIDYQVGTMKSAGGGIDPPGTGGLPQFTFGPTIDPDGSLQGGNKFLTGDETGFTAFTQNTNVDSTSPIPVAPPDFIPYPGPNAPTVLASDGQAWTNDVQGPKRNMDWVLINYEGGFMSRVEGPGGFTSAITPFTVNPGNRWLLGFGFYTIETARPDYGFGIDDVVFEWDERHPVDESATPPNGLGKTPACQRIGQPGQAAGQQCAVLAVDRGTLYECDESVTVTVSDAKRAGAGSVQILGASDSDARPFSTGRITALHPVKTFTLPEVAPGVFSAAIPVTQTINNPTQLFVSTGDQNMHFYYMDPLCDGNANGVLAQNEFDNLDGDDIDFAVDNCPFDYNPSQADADLDGLGNECDNCPFNSNNGPPTPQADSDGDGVGDACDLDDVDFDGVVNATDNCPDVYNPFQTPAGGQSTKGLACDKTTDRDGDGFNDRTDNCVRTYNPSQANSDGDNLGNACDGDCTGAAQTTLAIGSCNRSSQVECTTNAQCPTSGTCQEDPNRVCTSSSQQCTCVNIAPEVCVRVGITNTSGSGGSCSLTNDDTDTDNVADAFDNCAVISNPIPVGGVRQTDSDNDGKGDACDSPFMTDGDNNGIPDDIISFGVEINCARLPLPSLVVEASFVNDLNGDMDVFCDTGEQCEMTVIVANTSPINLTNVSLHLASADADIECITVPTVFVGDLPAGAKVNTSSVGGQRRPFRFTASQTVQTTVAADPAKGDFSISQTSREAAGTRTKVNFSILMDLDIPIGVAVTRVAGPDGIPGTADDGTIAENFDIDRSQNSQFDLSDGRDGVPNDTIGFTVGTAAGGLNQLSGIGCGGYNVPPNDPNCSIEDDNDMGWHIHCPSDSPIPCPPTQTVSGRRDYYVTPADSPMAFSGNNSLHWGKHASTTRNGDTTSFRELASFTTNPINLTPLPLAGDLELSFFHIADMMDNNEASLLGIPPGMSVDHGDVHIRVDLNGDPAVDSWGFWDKLAPFENVYDHIPYIWSYWGARITYCNMTPTDVGSGPPAPRGVRETMCRPFGVYSHCGNAYGTAHTFQCPGPGVPGSRAPATGALWVQSKFSLANFLGQRVQIRWIAQGWEFDPFGADQDYFTYGRGWENNPHDDGWWVDDIRITGAITAQATPLADTGPIPASTCPATPGDSCNQSAGDGGYSVAVAVRDTGNGNGIFEKGEVVEFDATGTTNPGGCANGITLYEFRKNGTVAQSFSANAFYRDAPTADATYTVHARCSVDPSCTSTTGATRTIQVYTGDGEDIRLLVSHDRANGITTLRWQARPQPVPMSGYDVFRGTIPPANLSTLASVTCDTGAATPVGTDVLVTSSAAAPAAGQAHFYLVGHSNPTAGSMTALGRHTNGTVRIAPVACP